MELYDFTAVLDEMTRNTYVMIIVHDPTIGMRTIFILSIQCGADCVHRNSCFEAEYQDGTKEVRGTSK